MKKKIESTYNQIATNPKRKKRIEKEYQELLISEILCAAMQQDTISVRKLAAEAGVSPTIIQELKTGKNKKRQEGAFRSGNYSPGVCCSAMERRAM